jgi:hypothetical protein
MTLFLSGCNPQSTSTPTNIPHNEVSSKHPVTVVMSTNSNIPVAKDKNPISAAVAAMSWKLSNGKTVQVSSTSDIVAANVLRDISVVTLKVPDVHPVPLFYFIYMEKQKNLWTLRGILGSSIKPILENTDLSPYSNLIHGWMTIKPLGRFEEFYSDRTVITLANLPTTDTDLPTGEKLLLHQSELPTDHVHRVKSQKSKKRIVVIIKKSNKNSIQPVTLFSQGNEHGLYYRFGPSWICVEGNVSEPNLIRISKDLQSHVFNVLGSGYYIGK